MVLFQWFSKHAWMLPGLFLYFMALPMAHAEETVQDLRYSYDATGNILQIEEGLSQWPQIPWVVNYQYDDLNRLLKAESIDFPGSDYTRSYTYDSIGNMTTSSKVGAMTYGGNGFPSPHAVTGAGGKTYAYDANGNMVSDGVHEYTWTIRNELEGTDQFEFTYDASGQRVKSIDNETGEETIYVNAMMEIRNGKPVYFVYAGSERVAQIEEGKIQYLHPDHLGGVSMVTDEEGKVVERYEYDPYGEILVHDEDASPGPAGAGGQLAAADSGSPYSFTGKEYDEDLGLYYFEARYYNPELGRFVGMDPMQHQDFSRFLNDPQAFNGYSYARNNPLVYVDPSGEMFVDSGNIFWLTVSAYLEYSKPFSASWLRHSINWGEGDPSNLYYGNRSSLAGSIRNSNDYAQLKDKILEDIRTSNDGHTVFNFQSNDLSTSLGGVEIYYEIYENEDDKYANITISDNYNFELDLAYENIVTAIGNNIAVVSEGINDLNSFGITIKLTNVKFDDEN